MDVCGLPKARPISCNDCPAFQRRHTSVLCAAESPTRFPWLINTTFEEKIHIRWCCINLLRPQRYRTSTCLRHRFHFSGKRVYQALSCEDPFAQATGIATVELC